MTTAFFNVKKPEITASAGVKKNNKINAKNPLRMLRKDVLDSLASLQQPGSQAPAIGPLPQSPVKPSSSEYPHFLASLSAEAGANLSNPNLRALSRCTSILTKKEDADTVRWVDSAISSATATSAVLSATTSNLVRDPPNTLPARPVSTSSHAVVFELSDLAANPHHINRAINVTFTRQSRHITPSTSPPSLADCYRNILDCRQGFTVNL